MSCHITLCLLLATNLPHHPDSNHFMYSVITEGDFLVQLLRDLIPSHIAARIPYLQLNRK